MSYFVDETLKEKFKPHVFFVWGVLPGERFVARLAKVKSKAAHGILARHDELLEEEKNKSTSEKNPTHLYSTPAFCHPTWALYLASKERLEPDCENFLRCGGCKMRHVTYETSLRYKTEWLKTQLTHHKIPTDFLAVDYTDASERVHYRNHIQVHINKFGVYGFYEPLSYHTRAFPEHGCLIFDEKSIRGEFPKFPLEVRTARIRQNIDGRSVFTVFNSKEERSTTMRYTIAWPPHTHTHIDFPVTQFFQVHLRLLPRWLQTIASYLSSAISPKDAPIRVLELFSGFGFISRMLAQVFNLEVVAADLLQKADVERVVLTSDAGEKLTEDFHKNYHRVDLFLPERLDEKFLESVERHNPEVLLVNPPRAGLAEATWNALRQKALCNFSGPIIYSSCNTATLARDLAYLLQEGWQIRQMQLFDFFPWTHHSETVVLLAKR
ncbi:MAG TPA: hypothetical protein PLY93_01065 [Turneriella sp.]|nr:hypothetical protein [Turneriella sp.]